MDDTSTYQFVARRRITAETHERFNALTRVSPEGQPLEVGYEYPKGSFKVRSLTSKRFRTTGDMANEGGFGPNLFPAGSSKAITIVEGEDDCMSVWQMLGDYPVYSVRSASSARKDCAKDFEYLNSFEKIYLALDNDGPGKAAAKEVAAIFDATKVFFVSLNPYKDPHEFLEAGEEKLFKKVWYGAKRYLPEGVVSSFSDIDKILDGADTAEGFPWPFPTLNEKTEGIKTGKSYLISGLEGIGKTEFFHAVQYHILKHDPEANIGILHLEEPVDISVKSLAGYELQQPLIFDDCQVPRDTVKATFKALAGRDDRVHFYQHFGSDEPDALLQIIRFLVAGCGCKYIFFDNITLTATGRTSNDTVQMLDYLSTRLEMLVKELNFALLFISHENDNEATRGSRNISKVVDVWINIRRDVKSEDPFGRNIQTITLFKNRGGHGTGPCGRLFYDADRATLYELSQELPTD